MSESVSSTNSPSRRQIALQLATAIMSNPNITNPLHPEQAVDQALQVLNLLEQRLRLPMTRTTPEA